MWSLHQSQCLFILQSPWKDVCKDSELFFQHILMTLSFSSEWLDFCLCTLNIEVSRATGACRPDCRAAGTLGAVCSGHTAPPQPLTNGLLRPSLRVACKVCAGGR